MPSQEQLQWLDARTAYCAQLQPECTLNRCLRRQATIAQTLMSRCTELGVLLDGKHPKSQHTASAEVSKRTPIPTAREAHHIINEIAESALRSACARTCTQSARSASVCPLGRRRSVSGPGSGAARVSTVAAASSSVCTMRQSSACSSSARESSRRQMGALSAWAQHKHLLILNAVPQNNLVDKWPSAAAQQEL